MLNSLRLVAGFLIAPVTPVLLAYAFILLATDYPDSAPSTAQMMAFFAYPAALLLGVPAYLILCEKRMYGLGSYLIAGILVGMTCFMFPAVFFVLMSSFPLHALKDSIGLAVIAVGCGLISSAAFWIISIYRRKV